MAECFSHRMRRQEPKQQYLCFCIKVGSLRNCVDDLLSLALNEDTYNRMLNICLISGRLKLGYKIYRTNVEAQYIWKTTYLEGYQNLNRLQFQVSDRKSIFFDLFSWYHRMVTMIVIYLQRLEAGNKAVIGDLTPSRLDKCHIRV